MSRERIKKPVLDHDWQPEDSTGREIQCARCGVRDNGRGPRSHTCPAPLACSQPRPDGRACRRVSRFAYLANRAGWHWQGLCKLDAEDLARTSARVGESAVIAPLAELSLESLMYARSEPRR